MARQTGKIKLFNQQKGFGFIVGKSGDIFFHASALDDGMENIAPGTDVTFDTETAAKGPRAVDILKVR